MKNKTHRKTDIAIIGAGPAGCIAAQHIKNAGMQAIVVEKHAFPRFVIGESLLPKCMEALEQTGLIKAVAHQNHQKKFGAIFIDGQQSCRFNFAEQFAPSHPWTWQVKRADFDQQLASEVAKNGTEILFEHAVENIDFSAEKQTLHIADASGNQSQIEAKFVLDASGYGRVIPRLLQLNTAPKSTQRGAVFTHYKDASRQNEEDNNITVHTLEDESWMWVIPFSDGTTSVGIVGKSKNIEKLAHNNSQPFLQFVEKYAPLHHRFAEENKLFVPKSHIAYSIGVKKMYGQGFALCGNSTEFLDPIFSSGVTLAMESGLQAATLAMQQVDGKKVDWETEYEQKMRSGLDVFSSYVDAWYNGDLPSIFFNEYIDQTMKEQICSVLAGHVWDEKNPFVTKHKTVLKTLAKVIALAHKK